MKNFWASVVFLIVLLSVTVDTAYGQNWLRKRRYRRTGINLHVYDAYGQRWLKSRRYSTLGINLNAINYFGEMAPE